MKIKLLAIDPSGNFSYGKGTTGLAIWTGDEIKIGSIQAKNYKTKLDYYNAIQLIIKSSDKVVCEDFKLQFIKAKSQSNKPLETSELIGILENYAKMHTIPFFRQSNNIKSRWQDRLLKNELKYTFNYELNKSNIHERDALRHLIHFYIFKYIGGKK